MLKLNKDKYKDMYAPSHGNKELKTKELIDLINSTPEVRETSLLPSRSLLRTAKVGRDAKLMCRRVVKEHHVEAIKSYKNIQSITLDGIHLTNEVYTFLKRYILDNIKTIKIANQKIESLSMFAKLVKEEQFYNNKDTQSFCVDHFNLNKATHKIG